MWMSAAQMSLSVLRGGGALAAPIAPRGAPGPSLESGGRPEAELTSVSSPVLPSTEKVVTVPSSSLNAYRNLLSLDVTKWRGPVIAFIRYTAGVFELSLPVFASNVNWKIASLPSVGT